MNNLNNIIPKNNMNRWDEQEDIDFVEDELLFEEALDAKESLLLEKLKKQGKRLF